MRPTAVLAARPDPRPARRWRASADHRRSETRMALGASRPDFDMVIDIANVIARIGGVRRLRARRRRAAFYPAHPRFYP